MINCQVSQCYWCQNGVAHGALPSFGDSPPVNADPARVAPSGDAGVGVPTYVHDIDLTSGTDTVSFTCVLTSLAGPAIEAALLRGCSLVVTTRLVRI